MRMKGRALGVAAMASWPLWVQGCGVVGCDPGVTVRAPEALADPSEGSLTVCELDMCTGSQQFEGDARSVQVGLGSFEGVPVNAALVMPDNTTYQGGAEMAERRTTGTALGDTCLVATIELEAVDP